jgi:prepilin-type N-terminal cleavage/methylation domain-containing protein/prepilin-type processing-associated H-X9-DG protein
MRRRGSNAFTLIELLVVIAVLALLAALLFPVHAEAREKARQALCLSNCKQIGTAVHLYLQDYDETFFWNPLPGDQPASYWEDIVLGLPGKSVYPYRGLGCAAQPRTSYFVLLQPYLRSTHVFRCPSYDGYAMGYHQNYAKSLDPLLYQRLGYGVNEVLVSTPCRPRTLATVKHSHSEVALFADASSAYRDPGWVGDWEKFADSDVYWFWQELLQPPPPGSFVWHDPPRHHKGTNFIYVDGHAKLHRPVLRYQSPPSDRNPSRQGYYPHARLQ